MLETRPQDGIGDCALFHLMLIFNGETERPENQKMSFIRKQKHLLEWVLFQILNMADFDKFIEPKAVQEMLTEYKNSNDYIKGFG